MADHASELESLVADKAFDGEALFSEPMSRHTSYRIGGPARIYIRADSISSLTAVVEASRASEVPMFVCGRGTNLLVSDDGFDGVVIVLGRDFKTTDVEKESKIITAGAASLLAATVQDALTNSLAGMEFAVGTPGTIGGAVRMNAGSADMWIGSRIKTVTILDENAKLKKLAANEIEWGYRRTSFGKDDVILEAELALEEGDPFFISGKMEGNLARRKRTQPIGAATCGSVFRNPEGASAGALIEKCGLKGYRIGGARISDIHANFIVNEGGASAHDVVSLIELAQRKVFEEYGAKLTPEVRFLGF